MVIITIEFPVLNNGITYTRENRARRKERQMKARDRNFILIRSKSGSTMATLLSFSFRLSFYLIFFFFAICAPRAIIDTSDAKADGENETKTMWEYVTAAYTCICYCDMDVNRLGGLQRMWGESRFR